MNKDGTFETRKEIYEAFFRGETIKAIFSEASYYYVRSIDQFSDGKNNTYQSICIENPSNWRILKPKKRRLIKDHVKQATRLLYADYVPDENCWYAPDGEIAFYNALWACSGDEVYDTKDGYYNTMKDGSGYEIRKEWTEEYDGDE